MEAKLRSLGFVGKLWGSFASSVTGISTIECRVMLLATDSFFCLSLMSQKF